MLNKIRESFQHTRPSDDPVSEVMDRLPEHIVKGYLENVKLKHAGVLLGLQQSNSGMNLILTKRTTKLKNHAGEISLGTGFIVTPVIALIGNDFRPIANEDEVEEIFHVPIDFFIDQANLSHEYRIYDQIRWSVYSYTYKQYYIWGLTAQIIRKFCSSI